MTRQRGGHPAYRLARGARRRRAAKTWPARSSISTIVSSSMLDALAAKHGFELRRTLTGFKYIGEQIGLLEAAGEADRYLFGFEESYGYLAGTHVRDKDAVVASMLICEMARDYKARGMDLVDAMEALYREHGHYRNATISLSYPGAEGAAQMKAIMANLRAEAPAAVAGLAVEKVVDYAPGVAMPIAGAPVPAAATLPTRPRPCPAPTCSSCSSPAATSSSCAQAAPSPRSRRTCSPRGPRPRSRPPLPRSSRQVRANCSERSARSVGQHPKSGRFEQGKIRAKIGAAALSMRLRPFAYTEYGTMSAPSATPVQAQRAITVRRVKRFPTSLQWREVFSSTSLQWREVGILLS